MARGLAGLLVTSAVHPGPSSFTVNTPFSSFGAQLLSSNIVFDDGAPFSEACSGPHCTWKHQELRGAVHKVAAHWGYLEASENPMARLQPHLLNQSLLGWDLNISIFFFLKLLRSFYYAIKLKVSGFGALPPRQPDREKLGGCEMPWLGLGPTLCSQARCPTRSG